MKLDSNLYRRIIACWGSFQSFRCDVGLPATLTKWRRRPNSRLREWCIEHYLVLTDSLGLQPNTAQIIKLKPELAECIRIQWGSFEQFCDDLKFSPARRHHRRTLPETEKCAICRSEYLSLMQHLGRHPTASDMKIYSRGLLKRIVGRWGTLENFRRCLFQTPQQYVKSLPD